MKRLFLLALSVTVAASSFAAGGNLYEDFKDHAEIKIYLREVTSEISAPHGHLNTFKSIFNDVLEKRLNMTFVPVRSASQADVLVISKIKEYNFRESVMPMFFSAASLIADTTAPKSGAKLVVDYEIMDAATGKLLLTFKNFTTDERRPQQDMIGDKAFEYAAARNINSFIYRAFYKQRKRRGFGN